MYLYWLGFVGSMIVCYVGISIFGQMSGGSSTSATQAFFAALRPAPFLVLVVANMFFSVGLYFGFLSTRFAIPAALSMGVLVSFVYSILFLGAEISLLKILGVAAVLVGIVLLGL